MVEVLENGDGTLDFQMSRSVGKPGDDGIPGLITPEILAMDKYLLNDAEFISLVDPGGNDRHPASPDGNVHKSKSDGYWPTIFLPPDLTLMTPGADIVLSHNYPRAMRSGDGSSFIPLPEMMENTPAFQPPVGAARPNTDLTAAFREIETTRISISSLRPPPAQKTPAAGAPEWSPTASELASATAGPVNSPHSTLTGPGEFGNPGTPLFTPSLLPGLPSLSPERLRRPLPRPLSSRPIAPTPELPGAVNFGAAQTRVTGSPMLFPSRSITAAGALQSPGTVSPLPQWSTPRPQTVQNRMAAKRGNIGSAIASSKNYSRPQELPEDENGITPVYAIPNISSKVR
ncbi:MAG: hypothetical protein LBT97_12915 [Planctomycetota bacterium]|nr:hypothetical protein [Planctomycetota bacterium]